MAGKELHEEVRALIGDGRWWERPFKNRSRPSVEPGSARVWPELFKLYPDVVCREMADRGGVRHIFGLFLDGTGDQLSTLLELGHDLADCPGWESAKKLVGDLREEDAYEAARLEVGIWAGLRRVGLRPEHEVAPNPSVPRADFVVDDHGQRIAIEAKSLGDPQRERNLGLLHHRLSTAAIHLGDEIGTLVLVPDAGLDAMLDLRVAVFEERFEQAAWPLIRDRLTSREHGRHVVPGLATVLLGPRDPSWDDNTGPAVSIAGENEPTIDHATKRVLQKVVEAQKQLAVTPADLRAVVIWGGLDHMPSGVIAADVARRLSEGFTLKSVDYIALLNSHGRSPRPGWTTEATVLKLRDGIPEPKQMRWPQGVVEWHVMGRGE